MRFSEGIFVGYRWFDQENIDTQFPFGHGLSYTQFQYSGLKTMRARDGVDVTFTIRNSGRVRGAEVAQTYVGSPKNQPVPISPKSLAGFERVELAPGQTKSMTIHIDARAFCYWSQSDHKWVSLADERPIYVGSSSRDIRLQGTP